ncbi:MAG: hypothetical protein A3I44_02720 [Candidatus Sungbacteria bacterium RIFCSPLOWO2_02_FULL_51_17]|uniref:AAA domain-containing protein n=1 Tax=Candidatus Sungbacteria bacterium RIFCSPHIGHO2_02_FULL_51_29 TaxID=1802273 RepID=A0A1G2KRH4_9BACT|nr:MAG: hypothetical protein A2676_06090 [Candidatus Sungbacteria bacterium RIFCSPHIGHO2_01_FULL_51_22]OHA02038.1 MAG: hypothetical protein A3C16_05790 [Candidatus Sungbacteria bacterium RIFCSPHIGHO2_02_FULL_51_29]OHA05182.1 MAG: hypothetical protein A3B29_05700 [Candidatus Sungbacteria bacterium RIFCSPLOWO2_01_FULL_51_34]OHA10849.1 MAG: hypothetical protein A3I44_02720 [Candidatus Sungbacteria bacterium RIFCSPLOWO2_02_FULL_51_17]
MVRIISFFNQKGGVGKTTSAVNTGAYLRAFGKKVLIVDIDPQANATSGIGVNPRKVERSTYDVLMGRSAVRDAIRKTRTGGIDVLPATADLAGAAIELVAERGREFKLREALRAVTDDYDYIIIDSPPSLGLLTLNALTASHHIIIPVQCEYYSLEGLAQLMQTIEMINKNLRADVSVLGALLTMFDRKSRLNRAVENEIRWKFPGYVFEAVIPRNIGLAEAPSHGKTIFHYDPYSHGAKAYRKLAQEIIKLEGIKKAFIA